MNLAIRRFTSSEHLNAYSPLRILAFNIVIAYGITSRGILNVRAAVRLALSYLLLAGYTGVVFAATWFLAGFLLNYFDYRTDFVQALLSGIAVTLLVNSTGTPLRRVARKILPAPDLDFEQLVSAVGDALQKVSYVDEVVGAFARVVRQLVGVPQVRVFLRHGESYLAQTEDEVPGERLPDDDPVLAALAAGAPDVSAEDLMRQAPSPGREALLARLDTFAADLILPMRFHSDLTGLLILGTRVSGRVYGLAGRKRLRLIAEQLGVALSNARLYTEARQSQAYNEFLVGHLSCGVIATDPAGKLTVVNREARRLLGIEKAAPLEKITLEPGLGRLIPLSLDQGATTIAEPIVLYSDTGEDVNLRVDCLPFFSRRTRLLGALLVLNDYTAIESLQRQVRQADRLATIGTLASGMAHEIKNPLTAIKTFIQLLPGRYLDEEFRNEFSGLASSEIGRLERILNQLLTFARPSPLQIERVALHAVVDGVVRLVTPQAARASVAVRLTRRGDADFVTGDKDRLQQVVLNLLLNAIQASHEATEVEIVTEMEPVAEGLEPVLRLDVRDHGCGIAADKLPHIFDPFFTTKSEGTGLGLSVSYNIIAEHKGRLEVRTEAGWGTCFSVYLPAS